MDLKEHWTSYILALMVFLSIAACYHTKIVQEDFNILFNDDGQPTLDEEEEELIEEQPILENTQEPSVE